MFRSGQTISILVVALLLLFEPLPLARSSHQILVDANSANGVISAGSKVINPTAPQPSETLQAELTLQNHVRLWFAIRGSPDGSVAPGHGIGSTMAHRLSAYYLLAPNFQTKFVGTFRKPGDRVALTATLNTVDAALLNIEQVLVTTLLAKVPGGKPASYIRFVEALQDFKRVKAVYDASQAFLPPPRTAKEWTVATAKATASLYGLIKDATQVALVKDIVWRYFGAEVSSATLKTVLDGIKSGGLLSIIAAEATFIIATKGKEPSVTFIREAPTAARPTSSPTAWPDGRRPMVDPKPPSMGNWNMVNPPPYNGKAYILDERDWEFLNNGLNGIQPDRGFVAALAFLIKRHERLTLRLISGYHTPDLARRSCECALCPVPNVSAHYKGQALDIFEVDGIWVVDQMAPDTLRRQRVQQMIRAVIRELIMEGPQSKGEDARPTQIITHRNSGISTLNAEIDAAYGPPGGRGNMGVFTVSTACYTNHIHVGW